MLRQLGSHGEEAGADYNDADDVDGWFGWTLNSQPHLGDVLTITYTPTTDAGEQGLAITSRWQLVPVMCCTEPRPYPIVPDSKRPHEYVIKCGACRNQITPEVLERHPDAPICCPDPQPIGDAGEPENAVTCNSCGQEVTPYMLMWLANHA